MIIQVIKLRSSLTEEQLLDKAKEREPQFRAIPGLLQKYYVKLSGGGRYGGVYVWDSQASLDEFRKSDLAAGIPAAYQLLEPPDIEIMDVLFQLRE